MITCTVKIQFSAAKRLLDYKGKCNQLHGYGHVVEASFAGKNMSGDMVADFYELKARLGEWIDKNWDHNVILNKKDKPLGNAIEDLAGQNIFFMEGDPTAENMAKYLFEKICPSLLPDVKCVKIRLYDTPDAFVEITA